MRHFAIIWSIQVLLNGIGFCAEEYQFHMLFQANMYRDKYQSSHLVMSEYLNEMAAKCVDYYINKKDADYTCPSKKLDKYKGETAGELVFTYGMANYKEKTQANFVERSGYSWTKNEKKYKEEECEDGTADKSIYQFTQLIWNATQEIGFSCKNGEKTFCVALFWPKGDVKGEFANNVYTPTHEQVPYVF